MLVFAVRLHRLPRHNRPQRKRFAEKKLWCCWLGVARSVRERTSALARRAGVQLPDGACGLRSKMGRTASESIGRSGGGCTGLKGRSRASESSSVPLASASNSESTRCSASRRNVVRHSARCFSRKACTRSLTFDCTTVSLSPLQAARVSNKSDARRPRPRSMGG